MFQPIGNTISSIEEKTVEELVSILKKIILNQNDYDLKNSIMRNDTTLNYHIVILYYFITENHLDFRYDTWSDRHKKEYLKLSGLDVDSLFDEELFGASIQRSNDYRREKIRFMICNKTIMSSDFNQVISEIHTISSSYNVGCDPTAWDQPLQEIFCKRIGL